MAASLLVYGLLGLNSDQIVRNGLFWSFGPSIIVRFFSLRMTWTKPCCLLTEPSSWRGDASEPNCIFRLNGRVVTLIRDLNNCAPRCSKRLAYERTSVGHDALSDSLIGVTNRKFRRLSLYAILFASASQSC